MRFSRARGPRDIGWDVGCDEEGLPGVEADGVGRMSSGTCKSFGKSRWCVGRLLVTPQEGRQQQE